MAVSEDFRRQWIEMEEQYGKNIEQGDIAKMEVGEVDETVSMPAVKFTDQTLSVFQEYRHVPMKTFMKPITDAVEQAQSDVAEAVDAATTATTQANAARDAANQAATSVENVNAALSDTTLIVTNRYGQQSSCDTAAAAKQAKAEWDSTYKPQINTATTNAQTASGYANTQGDYAKNMADHPAYLADGTAAHPGDAGYLYTWDYTTQQYVKGARLSIDFDSMTPEQREELARAVLAAIGFDTVPTENSEKAVTSGGLYIVFQKVNTALDGKQDTLTFATSATCEAIVDELV